MSIAVIGLGYVGLPLMEALLESGKRVLGYDVSMERLRTVKTYLTENHIGNFELTNQADELLGCEAFIVCVPTPLGENRLPDISSVTKSSEVIKDAISASENRPLVVLESSVAPGTTKEVFFEYFEENGLKLDENYLLGYSPERIDPGNKKWGLKNTPKLVSGASPESLQATIELYSLLCEEVVPADSIEAAETAKLFENTFRQVNIALVNELSMTLQESELDVQHILNLASTKPFGFTKFLPGPGVGGHCIPIDPVYLNNGLEKSYGKRLSLVDLADEINSKTPIFHAERIREMLKRVQGKSESIEVLLAGVAYKERSDDTRESPASAITRKLVNWGFDVSFFDPNVENFIVDGVPLKKHTELSKNFDAVMLLHKYDEKTLLDLRACADILYGTKGQI